MGKSSKKIAVAATLATIWPSVTLPQGMGGSSVYVPPATVGATGATVPAATATVPGAAAAPVAPGRAGGLDYTLGVDTSLRYDDNFELDPTSLGDSWIWDTRLTFGASSVTDTDTFTFNGSGVLRFGDFPGRTVSGFEDPTVRLAYSTDRKDSRFSINARYRNVDREFLNPFQVEQEEINSGGIYQDGGSVVFQDLGMTFDTGLNAPFGLSFNASYAEREYSNVTNPNLFDNRTDVAGVTARFDVTQVTRVTASAQMRWYTADDLAQTDRDTLNLSVGMVHEVNPALTVDAQVGKTYIDETKFGNRSERSGFTGRVGFVQTFADGSLNGSLARVEDVNGGRTTVQVGRTLQFPNGTLSGSIGLTDQEGGSVDWIGRVAYDHQMKSSNFSASLSRSATTNNSDQDILDTRIALGYGYQINSVSRLDLVLNYGLSEPDGTGGAARVRRTNLNATYTHALTSDWNLRSGVVIRDVDDSSASGPAHSNAVFVSLGRTFSFR